MQGLFLFRQIVSILIFSGTALTVMPKAGTLVLSLSLSKHSISHALIQAPTEFLIYHVAFDGIAAL